MVETARAIEAQGLVKVFGSTRAVDGVDLAVSSGSVYGFLGPNGAGKTTTMRILATLLRPDGGEARVFGHDVVTEADAVRSRIALTGQFASIDDDLTGEENLVLLGRLLGFSRIQARSRAADLLDAFGLAEAAGRQVKGYSGGMRRRIDIAASIVVAPDLMFLDEPTTGLDPRSRQDMWQVITELVRTGVSVLLTTQYLEEADALADTIAVINGGTIVALGAPAALKKQVADQRLELIMVDQAAFSRVRSELGARVLTAEEAKSTVSVATDGSSGHVRRLLDDIDPTWQLVGHFAVHEATLDDVFLALTGRPASIAGEPKEPSHV